MSVLISICVYVGISYHLMLLLSLCAERRLYYRQDRLFETPSYFWAKPVYTARIQSWHLAFAHLRCFDARLTKPDGSIRFNWWDRDNEFVKGTSKVTPYTDLFWAMFYKIAPFMGGMKKQSSSWRPKPPSTSRRSGR